MLDPRSLRDNGLDSLDRASIEAVDHYDADEPFVLESLTITAADLDNLAGYPVALDHCLVVGGDMSLARVCGIKNSMIADSKLRGTGFAKYMRNVVFESCQLTECTMRMMQLDRVEFDRCQLTGCDFYGSDLTKLCFPRSSFEGVGFDACSIDQVDLTEAADLQIGDPRTLRGAALRETQVPLIALRLAELTGIEVHEG